jgi:TetR/AcrR family fatty acid metabolism transcriptional regulator
MPVSPNGDGEGDRAQRQREQRRTQILSAAKEVFAEHGYHHASISAIIARANIARGTFYLYFSSKRSVFDSILDEAVEELRTRITRIEVGDGAEPPWVQIRTNLHRVMEFALDHPNFIKLLLSQGLGQDPEVNARVGEFYAHVVGRIGSSLRHGIEMGLVRPCDTEFVAAALLGSVRGIIDHVLASDEPPHIDKIIDELQNFALRGVLTSGLWE